ncbi:hypothetical protein HK405_014918 [Cladochytrium tenue]|nr:hypothetical protein HK405_014918 [Cladochytrium tenue]
MPPVLLRFVVTAGLPDAARTAAGPAVPIFLAVVASPQGVVAVVPLSPSSAATKSPDHDDSPRNSHAEVAKALGKLVAGIEFDLAPADDSGDTVSPLATVDTVAPGRKADESNERHKAGAAASRIAVAAAHVTSGFYSFAPSVSAAPPDTLRTPSVLDSIPVDFLQRPRTTASARRRPSSKPAAGNDDWRMRVWQAIRTIPAGSTLSYSDLAAVAGMPRAVRAVASAVARNPAPLLVPCHRVVPAAYPANPALAGFSFPGGIGLKRWLLRQEQEAHGLHETDVVVGKPSRLGKQILRSSYFSVPTNG